MGADTKSLRTRIRSVDSTMHLTKAMGLVASSKIRSATACMERSRAYRQAADEIIRQLSASSACMKSPYMAHPETGRVCLVVIAGDRGMAGGYNANIFREAAKIPGAGIIPIGKRACTKFGQPSVSSEKITGADCAALARKLCAAFCAGEFDRLGILSTRYVSVMTQTPQLMWVLPLERTESTGGADILFEPGERAVLEAAVPEYVTGVLLCAVRESFTCEIAARRMAMDSAGKNAQVMIDDLRLQYNRARQGAITQEITEIVAGSNQ